jgi:hypothetical protein
MSEPKEDSADRLDEVELALDVDEEQLARLDELIEEQATPSRRLTREEMLRLLVERGSEEVAQGASLLPYLEPAPAADAVTPTLTPTPTLDDTKKH